jgi:ATP-dependent Clp protease ATP-binding subunit ClpA
VFERFTEQAREAVVLAQVEARGLRHAYLGTEHLLLGVAEVPDGIAARVLLRLPLESPTIRAEIVRVVGEGPTAGIGDRDAEALRSIGIDVEEVRRRIEETFGPGSLDRVPGRGRRRWGRRRCESGPGIGWRLPFTPRAKKALELSLREALHLGHQWIGPEHLLLGLSREGDGLAGSILTAVGGSCDVIRRLVLDELRGPGASPGPLVPA